MTRSCERCEGAVAKGRCPVCGKWLCAMCRPIAGICLECWNTADGREADEAEKRAEKKGVGK